MSSHPRPLTALTLSSALALASSAAPLLVCPVAAQETAPGSPDEYLAQEDDATSTDSAPHAEARDVAPNTDACPHAESPAPARTTSEIPTPGEIVPPAPPVTYHGACGVTAPDGFTVPDEQTASAWLVFDLDSGEVIAEKDPHGRYRPASVIKVLLAMVALRDLPADQVVVASPNAANTEGSLVGIGAGGEYTVDELLHGLLMASGNDAAAALAETLGGDDATLAAISQELQDLGTRDTVVRSYAGLDRAGQMTSVWDLALMYRAAWADPRFAEIVNTDHVDFPGYGDYPGFQVWNDNGLLLNDPDGIGGKTGYTDDAQHTFVGALDRDGRRLAAVILDTTVDKGRPWQQAQRLLNAAYEIPSGAGVDSLTDAMADTDAAQPAATPAPTPEAAAEEESPTTKRGALIGGVAVAVVLALAGIVATLNGKTRGNHGTSKHRR